MPCNQLSEKLEAYLDGELTLSDERLVESHIESCHRCSETLSQYRLLQKVIQENTSVATPRRLKQSVKKQLKQLSDETPVPASTWLHWLSFSGGASALLAVTAWFMFSTSLVTTTQFDVESQILSAHVGSLMVDHLTDIESTDKHTVKPWFNGRLNFSPPVHKLGIKELSLLGGRLEYINNQPASSVVYKKRGHIINVFVYRANNDEVKEFKSLSRYSYNMVKWQKAGLHYWVVSDLNSKELNEFSALYAK